jgi:hypothetical protein
METRVAELEQKLDKLDLEAAAASGNAARAEALLVAFATRRLVQRGAPLGYLEDQLKLRFGAAQPDAVATVINFAHDPVTLDRLTARLEALGPMLAKAPPTEGGWNRIKRELSDLFVLRHESTSAAPDPRLRLDHARVALQEGKVEDAIADVRLMPGAALAQEWITQTQRYDTVQRALDAIETTALLEPKTLHDGAGREIAQPSPWKRRALRPRERPARYRRLRRVGTFKVRGQSEGLPPRAPMTSSDEALVMPDPCAQPIRPAGN